MNVDYDAFSGYGFDISADECERLKKVLNVDSIASAIDLEGNAKLPEGFEYFQYGNAYEGYVGVVVCTDVDLSEALRGEISSPDFAPLLAWAEKHGVNFDNKKPELFTAIYVH